QPVLGEGDVAHLPGDVADATWRLPEPLGRRRLVEQPDGVLAGKDDLLDGELESGHDYASFFGSVRTNFVARSIQPVNWSSSSPPSGSTATQFLIGLPVMSNARTCGSSSAASPSSGPRRAMSLSFQTPASALPLMKKQMQPNIFFSSVFLRRARASRMRA